MPRFNPSKIHILDDCIEVVANNTGNRFKFDTFMLDKLDGRSWRENDDGYLVGSFGGKLVKSHHLVKGKPGGDQIIDHEDRDKKNNRECNLRFVSKSQNQWNRSLHPNNSTGYKGVTFDKSRNKFMAQVGVNGKNKNLGRFSTAREAALAYDRKVVKYHGEFAVTNKMLGLI